MEQSISVLASAVDKIQMAGSENGAGTSDAKSIVLAAAESEKKVTNATHSALTRIATRQMSTKDGEWLGSHRRVFNINSLISHVVEQPYKISSTNLSLSINQSRSELNSHADTSVVGMNCLITHDYDKTVNVTGFDPSQGIVKDLKVVSAALAYD